MRKHAEIYLKNRGDFYAQLLPRIPSPHIRQRLTDAVEPVTPDPDLPAALLALPADAAADVQWDALALLDVFKKPAFGRSWGRTTISSLEALRRAAEIEQAGISLYDSIIRLVPAVDPLFRHEADRRRAAWAAVIQLDDDLRYHRLKRDDT
jgi:hypothetical protein